MPGLKPKECESTFGAGRGADRSRLAESSTEGTVDHFLEGNPEFAGTQLQKPGEIVVKRERGTHG